MSIPLSMCTVAALFTAGGETKNHHFTPPSITRLCPAHTEGDKEFGGHGPDVIAKATLETRADRKELWVVLYLKARETRHDWTTAEKQWPRKLYTTDAGYVIKEIVSHTKSETEYRDTNHGLDKPAVRGGKLIKEFRIMGDTGGNDVGNCTADDVYLSVDFNEIKLVLEQAN